MLHGLYAGGYINRPFMLSHAQKILNDGSCIRLRISIASTNFDLFQVKGNHSGLGQPMTIKTWTVIMLSLTNLNSAAVI